MKRRGVSRSFSRNNKKNLWLIVLIIILIGVVIVALRYYGSEEVGLSPDGSAQGELADYYWWTNKDRFKIYPIANNMPGKYYDADDGVIKPFTCVKNIYGYCMAPHDVTNVELTYNGKTECYAYGQTTIPIIKYENKKRQA